MLKIAVLVSGGGTNLQAIIDAITNQQLQAQLVSVIADRECYGLTRAASAGVVTHLVERKVAKLKLSQEISALIPHDCDLIVLAGFLSILDSQFIQQWSGKIINIHPSLLPKFGGSGMWGMNVHKAVVAAGDTQSGCTVHYVTEEIDGGDIILQTTVDVFPSDTPEDVQKRVLAVEHGTLVNAIKKIRGGIMVENFILSKCHINERDSDLLENVKNFAIIWNIFECECCNTYGSIGKDPEEIADKLKDQFVSDDVTKLNGYYSYFKSRYVQESNTNDLFNKNLFRKTKLELELKEKARRILLEVDPSTEDKIKCLLFIAFRIRNNFFHGEKTPENAIKQNKSFETLNNFLIDIIKKWTRQSKSI